MVELKALGEDFNPDFHQAVSMGHNDEYKENQVIEVLLKGYEYNGKVIRHAMVIVNK
ncbi:nucleotide exchange factor GrpE [Fenollaria massiliensis]|uniref:nucleotide exchange factor GrpE n=1 Tax=Fenollaria massiliensis TaxID=938288 RepID=UPI000A07BB44|nr:nucleotide exchange factor GrpE [Fenollaria massiliensis]